MGEHMVSKIFVKVSVCTLLCLLAVRESTSSNHSHSENTTEPNISIETTVSVINTITTNQPTTSSTRPPSTTTPATPKSPITTAAATTKSPITTAAATTKSPITTAAATTKSPITTAAATTKSPITTAAPMTCQGLQCTGPNCYTNTSTSTVNCKAEETHCKLTEEEGSPVAYSSGCSTNSCLSEDMCDVSTLNNSVVKVKTSSNQRMAMNCIMECCAGSNCLILNPPSTTLGVPASMSTGTQNFSYLCPEPTTLSPDQYSSVKRKCKTFACNGDNCYKTNTNKNPQQCLKGFDYCELTWQEKNETTQYKGGCSNQCVGKVSTSSGECTSNVCFQECCNTNNCLKLDGNKYPFNFGSRTATGNVFSILITFATGWAFLQLV